jgi:glycosyltransferase involved in cell wall biosynthesis
LKSESANKPKIIYVWDYLEWGGAQIYFLGIARRIKKRADILFVFPKNTGRQFIDFCENEKIEYQFLEINNDLKVAETIKRKFEKHCNKIRSETAMLKFLNKIDWQNSVVHVELAPSQSVIPLMRLASKTNVFITMHNRLPKVAKWRYFLWKLKFKLIQRFTKFKMFASNQDAKNSLKPLVSKDFWREIPVTYTNVNPDEIEEARNAKIDINNLKGKFGLPVNKFLVLGLGQFIDRKGRWIFLEAAKILCEKYEDIAFAWVSNSILNEQEIAKIESFGLREKFYLLGSDKIGSKHLDLMKFLRIADVYALPSFVEGLPISLLEAMAMGIASISTNVNAIPEAIKNLETGILIEKGNSIQLAEAIEKLKNNENLRRKLAENGRKFVLENFNEKIVAEIAFENYQTVLSNNK